MAREDASSRESSIRSASKLRYIYTLPLMGKKFFKIKQENSLSVARKKN